VLLGGGYALVVFGLGQLVGRGSSLLVAGATLAVAAAFQPVRRRIQGAVDRRFDRRRYDTARTIDGFSARLRQQVDLDTLTDELLAVVDQTMQPTHVSLWLGPRAPPPRASRSAAERRSGATRPESTGVARGGLYPLGMEVTVRAARPGDGADLARGWLDGSRYYTVLDPERFQVPESDGLTEWFEELLARPRSEDELWLVAEVDGGVVGTVNAVLQRPIDTAARQVLRSLGTTRLLVEALAVEADYQRKGIATRLMEAAEQWGRERGARLASLDTWTGSPISVPFYERRMGYERVSIVFEKRLDIAADPTSPDNPAD
jgi:GNAT superfamily N-acetyltransferase